MMQNPLRNISIYIKNINEAYFDLTKSGSDCKLDACFTKHLDLVKAYSQFFADFADLKTKIWTNSPNGGEVCHNFEITTNCLSQLSQLDSAQESLSNLYDYKNPNPRDLFHLLVDFPNPKVSLKAGSVVKLVKATGDTDYVIETSKGQMVTIPWIFLSAVGKNESIGEFNSLKQFIMEKHDRMALNMYKSTGYVRVSSGNREFVTKSFIWDSAQKTADNRPLLASISERNSPQSGPPIDLQRSVDMFNATISVEIYVEDHWVGLNGAIARGEIALIGEDLLLLNSPGDEFYPYRLRTTGEFVNLNKIKIETTAKNEQLLFEMEIRPTHRAAFLGVERAFRDNLLYWEGGLLFLNSTSPPALLRDAIDLVRLVPPNLLTRRPPPDPHAEFAIVPDPLLAIDHSGRVHSLLELSAAGKMPPDELYRLLSPLYSGGDVLFHRGWGSPCSASLVLPPDQSRWMCRNEATCDDLMTQALALSVVKSLWRENIWKSGKSCLTVKDALVGGFLDVARFRWTDPLELGQTSLWEVMGFGGDQWSRETVNRFLGLISGAFFRDPKAVTPREISPYGLYCWDSGKMSTMSWVARDRGFELRRNVRNGKVEAGICDKMMKRFDVRWASPPKQLMACEIINLDEIDKMALFYRQKIIYISKNSLFCQHFLNFSKNCRILCDFNSHTSYLDQGPPTIGSFFAHLREMAQTEVTVPANSTPESFLQIKSRLGNLMADVAKFPPSPDSSQLSRVLEEATGLMAHTMDCYNRFTAHVEEHDRRYWGLYDRVKEMSGKSAPLEEFEAIRGSLAGIVGEFRGSCEGIEENFKAKLERGRHRLGAECMTHFFEPRTTAAFHRVLSRYEGLAQYLDEITHKKLAEREGRVAQEHVGRLAQLRDRLGAQRSAVMGLSKKIEDPQRIDSFLREIEEAGRSVEDQFGQLRDLKGEIEGLIRDNPKLDLGALLNDNLALLTTARALLDLVADLTKLGRTKKEKELKSRESSKPLQELLVTTKKYLFSDADLAGKLKCVKDSQARLTDAMLRDSLGDEEIYTAWKSLKEDYLKKARKQIESELASLSNWFSRVNKKLAAESSDSVETEIQQYFKTEAQVRDKLGEVEAALLCFDLHSSLEIAEPGDLGVKRNQLVNKIISTIDLAAKRFFILKINYLENIKLDVDYSVPPATGFDDLYETCKSIDAGSIDLFCDIESHSRIFDIQDTINKKLLACVSGLEQSYQSIGGDHEGCRTIIDNLRSESKKRASELQYLWAEFGPLWEGQQKCLEWIDEKSSLLVEHTTAGGGQLAEVRTAQGKIRDDLEGIEAAMSSINSAFHKLCHYSADQYNPFYQFRLLLDQACSQVDHRDDVVTLGRKLESSVEEGVKLFSLNFGGITEGVVNQMINETIEISSMLNNYERLLECGDFNEETQMRFEEIVFEWADICGKFVEYKNHVYSTSGDTERMIIDRVNAVKQFSQLDQLCDLLNKGLCDEVCTTEFMENLYSLYYLTKGHVEVLQEERKAGHCGESLQHVQERLVVYHGCVSQLITNIKSRNVGATGKTIKIGLDHWSDHTDYATRVNSFSAWLTHVEGLLQRDTKSVALEIYNEAVEKTGDLREIIRLGNKIEFFREDDTVETPASIFRRWRALSYLVSGSQNDLLLRECELFVVEAENRLDSFQEGENPNILQKLIEEVTEKQENIKNELSDTNYEQINKKLTQLKIRLGKKLAEVEMGNFSLGHDEVYDSLVYWLLDAENFLTSTNDSLYGDLNTVKTIVDQYTEMRNEFEAKEEVLQEMRDSQMGSSIAYKQVMGIYERVNNLMGLREANLERALELAEELNNGVEYAKEIINVAEQVLRVKPTYHDNEQLLAAIQNHENFLECLAEEERKIDELKDITETIMSRIHPNAVRFVKYDYTISCANWEQIVQKAEQRTEKLNADFKRAKEDNMELEELTTWLTESRQLLAEKTKYDLPLDQFLLNQLLKEHEEFHDELNLRYSIMSDILERSFTAVTKKHNKSPGNNDKLFALWKSVRKISTEYLHNLQNAIDETGRFENADNVDFPSWRRRYQIWLKKKKLRILDFYRKNDSKEEGRITRDRFVSGHIKAGFDSPRGELNAIFSLFGGPLCNDIEYKLIVDAILYGRLTVRLPQRGESDELERGLVEELSKCFCSKRIKYRCISEGKFMIGTTVKYLKIFNGNLVVRVGGGWQMLSEYMQTVDPCREKRNLETLRDSRTIGKTGSGSHSSSNSLSTTRLADFDFKKTGGYVSEFARKFGNKSN